MNNPPQKLAEAGSEAIKSAPPLAVLGATVGGLTLQDWVLIATLGYLALQAGWLLWRWWRAASTKGWRPNE
jgi:hypothetical protein